MDKIYLHTVIPEIFLGQEKPESDIWQQEVCFSRGEISLVKAVSGAGKSSLCSYIYGYRRDYAGSIFFERENIASFQRKAWEHIRTTVLSMVFQDLRLFPELTALENVCLKNNLTGFKSLSWIKESFSCLGLEGKMATPTGKLSFGQQQRVALIRALCQPFDFILLDEPVSHLDDDNNRTCSNLLVREVRQQGGGMLVTSIGKEPEMIFDKVFRL